MVRRPVNFPAAARWKKKKPPANRALAKRLGVKPTRKFAGKRYSLHRSGTGEQMDSLAIQAVVAGRRFRVVTVKPKKGIPLNRFYLGAKVKPARAAGRGITRRTGRTREGQSLARGINRRRGSR